MPIITETDVKREGGSGAIGTYEALLFSDSGGLTQFGAFVEILQAGARSSVKHWHRIEDEMVYMLAGEAILHEGETEHILRPGDAATFRAGDPAGHCLENRSVGPVRYLVIGTRSGGDTVTYPDDNRVLDMRRDGITRHWTDLDGHPADPLP
ncbi:cupin domain-containing protein [Aestuariicoccus sp. MJ-SS9]|uniref:cupin domain-containing protein n=1 Tax=Aestuariicoccus sp. MJ-SS9 TaxID=3079855 RepID=UPI002907B56C|nr:cupin domain-containing protein [Aestuariicoccus sp. MJ-SS9]MDU8910267.1 cupin domain-containing protein [Aestuariicoccus sp. MJ-SS9]